MGCCKSDPYVFLFISTSNCEKTKLTCHASRKILCQNWNSLQFFGLPFSRMSKGFIFFSLKKQHSDLVLKSQFIVLFKAECYKGNSNDVILLLIASFHKPNYVV